MELLLLYLWMKLDTFRCIWSFCAVVGTVALPIALAALQDEWDNHKSLWKKCFGVWFLCASLAILVPSSNQMAGLVVGGVALKAVESPEAQKLLGLLRKQANEYLDEQLKGK